MKKLIFAASMLLSAPCYANMHKSPVVCVSPNDAFDHTTATVTLEEGKDGKLLLGFYGGPVTVTETEDTMIYETLFGREPNSYRRHLELTKDPMPDRFLHGSFSLDFPKEEGERLRCKSYPGRRLVKMDVRGRENEVIDTAVLKSMAESICGGQVEVAGSFISRFRPIWAIDTSMYVKSQAFFCIEGVEGK